MRAFLNLLTVVVVLFGAVVHAQAASMRVFVDEVRVEVPANAGDEGHAGGAVLAHSPHCVPAVLATFPEVAAASRTHGVDFVRSEVLRVGRDPATTHRPPIPTAA